MRLPSVLASVWRLAPAPYGSSMRMALVSMTARLPLSPADPWLYRVTLPPVEAGVYTVSWRVMSADDGHVTEGAYVFVVGGTAMSRPPEAGQVIAVTGWFDALTRWLGMLGAVALIGMLTAAWVFWRRRLSHVPPPSYVLPCLVVVLLASGLTLFARLQRLPVEGGGWAGLGIVLASTIGQITVAKLGVAVLLVGALVGYWWVSGRTNMALGAGAESHDALARE